MKNKLVTFYIVRHGESEANAGISVEAAATGTSPLTEKGKNQAKAVAETLKKIKFSAAYASDMKRAIQTAEIIAHPHALEISISPLIRERRYVKEGNEKKMYEIKKIYDEYVDTNNGVPLHKKLKFKAHEEMESGEEIIERFLTFLNETAQKHESANVLVVSHGNAMRTLLHYLGFAEPHNLPAAAVKNTGYIQLGYDGKQFFVLNTVNIEKIK